jgi:hypothetical protein
MMDFTNMMAPKKMIKQMVEFNKATFENSFKGIALFQEQVEQMSKTMLDQATWIPDEGKKTIDGMVDAYKSNIDSFKTIIDDNFKKVDEYLSV